MSDLLVAVSEVSRRIEKRYLSGDPYEFDLKSYRPEYEINSFDPLDVYEIDGPPLVGLYSVRALIMVEDGIVVSAVDGRNDSYNTIFGLRNTPKGLTRMSRAVGLDYIFTQD